MAWGARNLISTQVEMAPPTTSVKTCANVSDGCHASITSGSLDDLRTAVKHACGRSDVVLAASYSRKTLGQTGDGHFSPVGGYDAASDQVLLLDVARFKSVWKSTSVSGAPDNSSLSHFSAMAWPRWFRRAARNRHRHAIEQASRRWRGGRRCDSARTRRKILISTQD